MALSEDVLFNHINAIYETQETETPPLLRKWSTVVVEYASGLVALGPTENTRREAAEDGRRVFESAFRPVFSLSGGESAYEDFAEIWEIALLDFWLTRTIPGLVITPPTSLLTPIFPPKHIRPTGTAFARELAHAIHTWTLEFTLVNDDGDITEFE
jgi:hypothetical protein